eukprot:RCo015431
MHKSVLRSVDGRGSPGSPSLPALLAKKRGTQSGVLVMDSGEGMGCSPPETPPMEAPEMMLETSLGRTALVPGPSRPSPTENGGNGNAGPTGRPPSGNGVGGRPPSGNGVAGRPPSGGLGTGSFTAVAPRVTPPRDRGGSPGLGPSRTPSGDSLPPLGPKQGSSATLQSALKPSSFRLGSDSCPPSARSSARSRVSFSETSNVRVTETEFAAGPITPSSSRGGAEGRFAGPGAKSAPISSVDRPDNDNVGWLTAPVLRRGIPLGGAAATSAVTQCPVEFEEWGLQQLRRGCLLSATSFFALAEGLSIAEAREVTLMHAKRLEVMRGRGELDAAWTRCESRTPLWEIAKQRVGEDDLVVAAEMFRHALLGLRRELGFALPAPGGGLPWVVYYATHAAGPQKHSPLYLGYLWAHCEAQERCRGQQVDCEALAGVSVEALAEIRGTPHACCCARCGLVQPVAHLADHQTKCTAGEPH